MEIEEVPLPNLIIPTDKIGMVIMQPYVELRPDREPYQWIQGKVARQLDAIQRTLDIAQAPDHECPQTHFVVFPEYSMPGLPAVDLVDNWLNGFVTTTGIVVIGGLHGLTGTEFLSLCGRPNTNLHASNNLGGGLGNRWVNCCVTWVKKTDGSVERWIQPKMFPSGPEKAWRCNLMVQGNAVYIFKAQDAYQNEFNFFSLICFDWIAANPSGNGVRGVLHEIDAKWSTVRRSTLSLAFLLQYNPEPNDPHFLTNTREYYFNVPPVPYVERLYCVIVGVNTAGGQKPGKCKTHGYSSLVSSPGNYFNPKGCRPTYALSTEGLRNRNDLTNLKDALLRENGACIHSLSFRVPMYISPPPADKCWPIEVASVYNIDPGGVDPRTPGRPVPASVKWVNDRLERLAHLFSHHQTHPLFSNIKDFHIAIVAAMQWKDAQLLTDLIRIASAEACEQDDKWLDDEGTTLNVDRLDNVEDTCLSTIVQALTILSTLGNIDARQSSAHGTITIGDKVLDIIVVTGKTHPASFEHGKTSFPASPQRVLLIITRDAGDDILDDTERAIFSSKNVQGVQGSDITDPDSRTTQIGLRNIKTICQASKSIADLQTALLKEVGI